MCAGSQSGALKIWDLEATKIVRTLTGHKSNIRTIDFHPYGDFIGTGSLDTNIKVRKLARARIIDKHLTDKDLIHNRNIHTPN